MIRSKGIWMAAALCAATAGTSTALAQSVDPGIWVRPGYELTIANADLKEPRFIELNPDGVLFVSLPKAGEIRALKDENGDGVYEKVTTFVEGHKTAHGMDWHDGWLWFSVTDGILKARDADGDGKADETVEVLPKGSLPGKTGHWWRSILIHNNRLYTSVGDGSNATDEEIDSNERKKLWSFALDGSDKKLFASGIRNTEKYAVRPGTDEFWGMDHNSDWFGRPLEGEKRGAPQPITDVFPGEEFNKYTEGGFYGHPFIVGQGLPRYEFMNRPDIIELAQKTIKPEWNSHPHWAANGMTFYDADQFPTSKGNAFIAYHGSWNLTRKGGYKISSILFENGHPYGELTFVDFLAKDGSTVLGRPVDVTVDKDGSLLFSDDNKDKIYRLMYVGTK